MQDMVPKPRGERSIRNIPISPNHRRAPVPVSPPPSVHEEQRYEEDYTEPVLPRRKSFNINNIMKRNWFFWSAIGVVAVCAIGGILLSTLFAGATVSVTPHSVQVTPPATLEAAVNPTTGTLPYQIVSTSRTASTTVKATGTSQVSKSASGLITIYNVYSAASQPLITNTRFEAPDGKMYRIHSAVTVPGAKAGAGGALTPGTVTVTAYADQPGAAYNKDGQTQFTIPGFKGDPRYTKFYATADSVQGGFVGAQASVAPADLTSAQNALKQGLQSALQQAASTQIPKEYMAIPGTLNMSFADIVQTPGPDASSVTLSQTATASADTVRASDLAAAIAIQKVDGYKGEAVNFADPSLIKIALAGTSTASTGVLTLALSGTPTLVWQFDPNALKAALVGKPKGQFEQIVTSFAPAITCTPTTPCSAAIRPFWSSSFPSNPDKITVVTK